MAIVIEGVHAMKAFPHLLVFVITVMLISGSPFTLVKAINYNPAAEEYVKKEILAGGDADLAMAFENADERVISAEFIVALWQDPAFQAIPFFRLRNATIISDIEAEEITIPFDVELHDCTFIGGINLASTDVKTFRIDDSTVKGPVELGHIVVKGDLALYNSTFEGGVTLFGANISNNLFARHSKFLSTEPVPSSAFPFELWTTRVGETTDFTDVLFKGEVKADDAKFGVDVRFVDVVFEEPVSFHNIQVGNSTEFSETMFEGDADFRSSILGQDAYFTRATFNAEVSFESSILDRDAAFTGSTFNGNANFDYLAVARFIDFDQTTFNQDFSFIYTKVGWPYFRDAVFNGRVNFEGMQAGSDLDFTNVTYNYGSEPFGVLFAKVNGSVWFEDFTAPAGLYLAYDQFGNLIISGHEGQQFASINLDTMKIDGKLDVQHIETSSFSLNQSFVNQLLAFTDIKTSLFSLSESSLPGKALFKDVKVESQLDWSDVTFGKLILDEFTWPESSNNFNLRGTTYDDIELNSQKISQKTFPDFYNIIKSSTYDAEVYRTFEQFLSDKGLQDIVPEVELAKKQRERREMLTPYSVGWIWSWFLDVFAGYGQRPGRALLCSLLIIGIGAIVYRKESDLVSLNKLEEMPPYNPILYSFALFLPLIDLGIADKWNPKPSRKGAWMYKHFHKLLGWILTPIAILTFGGFIK